MQAKAISKATLDRLPVYLSYLKALPQEACPNISATALAQGLSLGEVQVRKDLAAVSDKGKPRVGYAKAELIRELESFLGYNDMTSAFVVGCGKLGRALLEHDGFAEYGMELAAGFDSDPAATGMTASGKEIFPLEKLGDLCRRMQMHMAILCVPREAAQEVCDMLVASGIKGIMNFAPVHLRVPEGVLLQNEDLAAELAKLSAKLTTD